MLADIQFRTTEIEQLIASNELNTATKRVMDFVADFGVHRNRKKEAIDLRARYNALRENLRRDVTPEISAEQSQLRRSLLDFIEQVKDENSVAPQPEASEQSRLAQANEPSTMPEPVQSEESPLSGSQPAKADGSQKTRFEQDKEAFLQRRNPPPPEPPNLVFYGKNIQKKYGSKSIDFTFHIPELELKPGEITAVVGENGNGKTTLLRIVAGQLQINAGTIEYPLLVSKDKADLYATKQKIAYIPQDLEPWSGLLADNLHFSAAIHGITAEKNEEEVDFIVNRLGLEQYKDATWKEISGGYRMRFALARALVWNPTLLILDEPLANLDINTQMMFLQDLRYLASSTANPKSIIISSQNLHSVEDIAENIIFIQDGTALYNGRMKAFGQDRKENSFEFACSLSKEQLADILEEIPSNHFEEVGYYFSLDTPTSVSANDVLALFVKHNVVTTYFRDISKSTRKLFKLEK